MSTTATDVEKVRHEQHAHGGPPTGDAVTPPATTLPNARPVALRSTAHEILFVFVTTMGVAMPSLLQGSTIVISSFAGRDLNMTAAEITWMTASSALTSGSFLLFFGKLADTVGRRSIFIVSLALFAVLTLATGFSKDAITLNVLNGVIGLVCASTVPSCQGILGTVYDKPSKRKNLAFASFSAGNPLGFVLGSIFSGIATQLLGWRASFWLLAIEYALVAVIACFVVPNDTTDKLPLNMKTLKQFDVVGALLTISGIGLFSAGLSIGPEVGWTEPYILVFLVLGVLLLVAFVFWECRFPYPLMPMKVWLDRNFTLLMGILMFGFIAFPPMSFFIALYLQQIPRFSALQTAVHMLPMAVSGIIVNAIAGLILHSISNKLLMGLGAASYTVAFLLFAVQRTGDPYWAFTFPALVIVVIGADLEFNVANMYVLSSLPLDQQSTAGSIFQTITKLCVVVGLGAGTAILRSVEEDPASSGYYANDPFEPFAAVSWFAMACTAVSLLLVPFLKITTQGHG